MTRDKKILAVCFVISTIAVIVMIINAIINPTISLAIVICTGIIPVYLFIHLISSKAGRKK